EVIKDFKNKFNAAFGGGSSSNSSGSTNAGKSAKGGAKYLIILAILVWLLSGIYIVDPAERGVVLRFGAFQEITSQGPHWRLPYPIEQVYKVNVEQIRAAEIGFRNIQNSSYGGNVSSESLMLTKDENMIVVNLAVQYKIVDAKAYLFNVLQPEMTLSHVVQSVIRQVVGDNTMDFVLTTGREQVAQAVKSSAQALLNDYQTGLIITAVTMQDAQPPVQVKAAFDDVVKAREDQQRYINEATAYENDILPKARGASQRIMAEAEAYRSQVTSKSEGEADRFGQILAEYLKAPEVTRERLYRETLEEVLSTTNKVVVDGSANALMYLPIDQLVGSSRSAASSSAGQSGYQSQTSQSSTSTSVLRSREVR
ncbi:MAG: FtsH protease activity modulator HflK, partial [Gammaproteobacteria bacterium]|nr:FtsH protease activity modulator HflK [Gammaproteobacteria bacterium]